MLPNVNSPLPPYVQFRAYLIIWIWDRRGVVCLLSWSKKRRAKFIASAVLWLSTSLLDGLSPPPHRLALPNHLFRLWLSASLEPLSKAEVEGGAPKDLTEGSPPLTPLRLLQTAKHNA